VFTPSIVPSADDTVYLVEDDFGAKLGRVYRETDSAKDGLPLKHSRPDYEQTKHHAIADVVPLLRWGGAVPTQHSVPH
jgi:hypothetical protein